MQQIQRCRCGSCRLTFPLKWLAGLKKPESLSFVGTAITDAGAAHFAKLTKLKGLLPKVDVKFQ